MQTPDQQAENALRTLLDAAIGPRSPELDDRVRAGIWEIIREAQLDAARASEEAAS